MAKAPKAEVSKVKEEAATPEVAPPVPSNPKASDKPNPNAKPKKVYVSESGLTIEEY